MINVEDILTALVGRGSWLIDNAPERNALKPAHELAAILDKIYDDGRTIVLRKKAGIQAIPTATGRSSRNRSTGSSLTQQAVEVTAGMNKSDWSAILWVVSRDTESFKFLHDKLVKSATNRKGWPNQVRRQICDCGRAPAEDYRPDLARLALYELLTPDRFRTHAQRAEWFGLSQQHWRRLMADPYAQLVAQVFGWFGNGCTHIAKRLGAEQ